MKNENEKYCFNCGGLIDTYAEICPKCGVRQFAPPFPRPYMPLARFPQLEEKDPTKSDCDWMVTLILCICLGFLGAHRFYTRNTGIGIIQLLSCGGIGIWWIVDLIMLVTNSYRDGDGQYVKD